MVRTLSRVPQRLPLPKVSHQSGASDVGLTNMEKYLTGCVKVNDKPVVTPGATTQEQNSPRNLFPAHKEEHRLSAEEYEELQDIQIHELTQSFAQFQPSDDWDDLVEEDERLTQTQQAESDNEEDEWNKLPPGFDEDLTNLSSQQDDSSVDCDVEVNVEPKRRQVTLTQCVREIKRPKRENHWKDTEDEKYLNVFGNGIKMFRRGETFRNTTVGKLQGWYFTIENFDMVKGKKYAICPLGACMDIRNTFIGEKFATELVNDSGWQKLCPKDFDKVRIRKLPRLKEQGTKPNSIHLSMLNSKPQSTRPEPTIVFEPSPTQRMLSNDFSIAYKYSLPGDIVNWMEMVNKEKPDVLELFAGGGGMSLGLEQAGFNVKWMVDHDASAVATLKTNFRGRHVFRECVRIFLRKLVEGGHPTYPKRGEVKHVHSSSPCQDFSRANRAGGNKDSERNQLSLILCDYAEALGRPTSLSMENVTGMMLHKTIEYPQRIITNLLKIGYQSRLLILNAKDYGVPQDRQRVFIFAARFECMLPSAPPKLMDGQDEKSRFSEVLSDLVEIEPQDGSGIVQLPDGTTATGHNLEGTDLKSDSDHLSQCIDGNARTVRCHRPVKHHSLKRNLTNLEKAWVQGFPRNYAFEGKNREVSQQIGNAVPVPLAKCVGEMLMEIHTKERVRHPV